MSYIVYEYLCEWGKNFEFLFYSGEKCVLMIFLKCSCCVLSWGGLIGVFGIRPWLYELYLVLSVWDGDVACMSLGN